MNDSGDPRHVLGGLTFQEARGRILHSLQEICAEFRRELKEKHGEYPALTALLPRCLSSLFLEPCEPSAASSLLHKSEKSTDEHTQHLEKQQRVILCAAALVFSLYLAAYALRQSPHAPSGLLLTLVAMSLFAVLNAALLSFYRASCAVEVFKAVQRIAQQYEFYLKKQEARLALPKHLQSQSDESNPATYLPTGHSQISIFNTLRGGQWVKLPLLLLAEGDVIALMGGDVAPCRVVELRSQREKEKEKERERSDRERDREKERDWEEGEVVEAGTKIHILSHTQSPSPTNVHFFPPSMPSPAPLPPREPVSDFSYDRQSQSLSLSLSVPASSVPVSVSPSDNNAKHRSVDPESIEILRLCGNIRCFRLRETPMRSFAAHTVREQQAVPLLRGGLFLHKLKRFVHQKTSVFALSLLVVLVATGLIRVFLSAHTPAHYAEQIFVAVATTVVLLAPLSSPSFSVLVEAFATAEVLTTLEVAHESGESESESETSHHTHTPSDNAQSLSRSASRRDSTNAARPSSHNTPSQAAQSLSPSPTSPSTANPITHTHTHAAVDGDRDAHLHTHTHEEGPGSDAEDEEFIDEDLDARVEDIAEQTATKVMYFRFFHYVLRVLHARLLGGLSLSPRAIDDEEPEEEMCERDANERNSEREMEIEGDSQKDNFYSRALREGRQREREKLRHTQTQTQRESYRPLLPIPLARQNVSGQLGAATMVCFVDDDVVSESFSVTEEIFLLNENQDEAFSSASSNANYALSVPAGGGTANSSYRPFHSSTRSSTGPFGPAGSAGIALTHSKLTVLDLHANPEATGSRFENPNWWRFLPCLKPLGLNALLTYKHTADHHDTHSQTRAQAHAHGPNAHRITQHAHTSMSYMNNPLLSTISEHGSAKAQSHTQTNESLRSPTDVEKSLVRHIRKTLPLEFLRELAEEIGFTDEDVSAFTRALEVNVIAPGLENAHLQEDNHQWGQEESRRRGSLLPHLRGAIYKDTRAGSLQMMSLGDPSLVLHYCREYWDGSTCSIVPLSAADRLEVLGVYERWRLEDFDVVAFCYTPVPAVQLQSLIDTPHTQTHATWSQPGSSRRRSVSGALTHTLSGIPHNTTASHNARSPASAAVFFVDPSSQQDLLGRKTRGKNDRTLPPTANNAQAHERETETVSQTETQGVVGSNNEFANDATKESEIRIKEETVSHTPTFSQPNAQAHTTTDENTQQKELREQREEDELPRRRLSLRRSVSDSNLLSQLAQQRSERESERDGERVREEGTLTPLSLSPSRSVTQLAQLAHAHTTDGESISRKRSSSHPDARSLSLSLSPSKSSLALSLSAEREDASLSMTVSPTVTGAALSALSAPSACISPSVLSVRSEGTPRTHTPLTHSLTHPLTNVHTHPLITPPLTHTTREKERESEKRSRHRDRDRDGSRKHHASNTLAKQQKRQALKQLWATLRQQVFLGMVASSVPVRKDVPNAKEDLDAAGIRFVYFSPQNMKRSKLVAEKIGIPFDWNCAISLRVLDSEQHDPHRHISNYADWDVLARMPHGIEAIKEHLVNVDNVPLLVSLFTDATPETTQQMLQIFRDNGEVVLAIGAAYRAYHQRVFQTANIASSILTLPNVLPFVPAQEQDLLDCFPTFHGAALTKCDLKLSFDLIGIGSLNLLQAHSFYRDVNLKDTTDPSKSMKDVEHLKLSVLLETIRKGRVLLLNEIQATAFIVVCSLGLSLWPLLSNVVPLSVAPSCPPPIALLLAVVYVPSIALSMFFSEDHEGVMKNTPRKSSFAPRARDESRFLSYLIARVSSLVLSVILTGIFTTASVFRKPHQSYWESLQEYHIAFENSNDPNSASDLRRFWLVQDVMSCAAVLAVIVQSFSMLARGQRLLEDFPWPRFYTEYYAVLVGVLVVHGCVLLWRTALRHCWMGESATRTLVGEGFCDARTAEDDFESYASLHYAVWIVLFACSVGLNLLSGFLTNAYDRHHHRRYTQFLRLEFDTRLGMHSPR